GPIWNDVLQRIETKVNRHSFDTWFAKTHLISDDGASIRVRVADPLAVDWLTRHYTAVLEDALMDVGRGGAKLVFIPEGTPEPEPAAVAGGLDSASDAANAAVPTVEATDARGLSSRYFFETFIVGASNQFAHAACRAVAEAPSRSYNPLFIYGGV